MKTLLLGATFAVGFMLAVHLAMNAAVGKMVANPRMGNAVFWVVGGGMAVLIGLSGWQGAFWREARSVPAWLWLAGAIGACLVFAIAALIPRLGAGTTNVVLLTGQVIGGILIAHWGLLGSPTEAITPIRLLGLAIMILGAGLAVLGKIPFVR